MASMRRRSVASLGLWSWESSTGAPLRHMMARESPALAQMTSVFESSTHTAVHPTLSAAPASGFPAGAWFSRRLNRAIFIITCVASSLVREPLSRACARSDWMELCRMDTTRGFGVSPSSSPEPPSLSAEEPEPPLAGGCEEPGPGACFSARSSRSCSGERSMSSIPWKPCFRASPHVLLLLPPSLCSCLRTSSGRCVLQN
mmetsp:Transcript_105552/g.340403  ORF Transcript_105552/g.340403 Transcript_105552/m.340403 type:complete len:201 (+) Transcript_105552:546-1148(+)